MNNFKVLQIGKINNDDKGLHIQLEDKYMKALKGLDEFSHLMVTWWFDKLDYKQSRNKLSVKKPYKNSPNKLGVFATRSPERPNPIGISIIQVLFINYDEGKIYIPYIDADLMSPVLDIKPYTPSIDRVETPSVPNWCSHWPKSIEKSGEFDWENEFNF